MSSGPGHADIQEQLPAAALTMLDAAEMARVQSHVRECPECAALLQEYREGATALALQLPSAPMDAGRSDALRARLLTRARSAPGNQVTRKASSMIYQWSGWMVAAGLAGILLVHHSVHRPLDYGWLAAAFLGVVLLAVGIYAWVQRNRLAELERESGEGGKG
jgi:anti-sigma factor RsiW